jgi:hypothetical protein
VRRLSDGPVLTQHEGQASWVMLDTASAPSYSPVAWQTKIKRKEEDLKRTIDFFTLYLILHVKDQRMSALAVSLRSPRPFKSGHSMMSRSITTVWTTPRLSIEDAS